MHNANSLHKEMSGIELIGDLCVYSGSPPDSRTLQFLERDAEMTRTGRMTQLFLCTIKGAIIQNSSEKDAGFYGKDRTKRT
jgi:hypothetical protein